MPLVNCGEGGKRQIAKRINCERRGKWQSYERRERRRGEGNVSSTYDATLLARSLACLATRGASKSLSHSQKHLGNV